MKEQAKPTRRLDVAASVLGRTESMSTVENNRIVVNIEIRKSFQRAMQEPVATQHVAGIIKETETAKWKLELVSGNDEDASSWYQPHGLYPTSVSIFFRLTGPNSLNADIEKNDRLVALAEAAKGNKRNRREWELFAVDGEKFVPMTARAKVEMANQRADGKSTVEYADVRMPTPEEVEIVFEDVIGCGPQIRMLMSRVYEAMNSNFEYRSHALLIGKPGAGKSFTLLNAKKLFPEEGAIMWIDGTAMTSAGIIDALKDAETMPRYIFVEEIDKADSGACSVLLGIMDKHGEIRKTTYRDKVEKECRCVVFATANSMEKMRKLADGALLSRFGGNPITYQRAEDDELRIILNMELDRVGKAVCCKPVETHKKDGTAKMVNCGSCKECKRRTKWIDATLLFSHENENVLAADTRDPRFIIDVCVNGGDRLIDKTYQEDLLATSMKIVDEDDWN
jgi:hypothetical protein